MEMRSRRVGKSIFAREGGGDEIYLIRKGLAHLLAARLRQADAELHAPDRA